MICVIVLDDKVITWRRLTESANPTDVLDVLIEHDEHCLGRQDCHLYHSYEVGQADDRTYPQFQCRVYRAFKFAENPGFAPEFQDDIAGLRDKFPCQETEYRLLRTEFPEDDEECETWRLEGDQNSPVVIEDNANASGEVL